MYFEIGLHSVCKTGSKFTLTVLVWLFSTVCCQMCPQMACLKGCKFTLVSCVSSNCLPERMQSHRGCICSTFLHCAFSNVSSKRLHKMMQSHIGCICLTFLHCAFSKHLYKKMNNHIGCICLTFLHCAISNVSSNRFPKM